MDNMDIIEKLICLRKQGATKHNHQHTTICINEAIEEIVRLRRKTSGHHCSCCKDELGE